MPLDVNEQMRADWNKRAEEDAYYYVAFGKRNQTEEEFESTASAVVAKIAAELSRLPAADPSTRKALEIGCGPARLMIPMSRYFGEIHGVDISDEMIRRAQERLADIQHAHAHVNSGSDLSLFVDEYFDFVYSYVVFQHIPSREVVLNYLREIRRVLRPGGVVECQLRGASAIPRAADAQPTTWNGCTFTSDEIAAFLAENGMLLLAISGEGTQYMWITASKCELRAEPDFSRLALKAVTAAHDGSQFVLNRGPHSCVSLWIAGMPAGVDLNSVEVAFNGRPVRASYLGPISGEGGCQINALVPANTPPGMIEVSLQHSGRQIGNSENIEVRAAQAFAPALISITDAVNLFSRTRIESHGAKVSLADVEDPQAVRFTIEGDPVNVADIDPIDPIAFQYLYTIDIPPALPRGRYTLTIDVPGAPSLEAPIEIAAK